MGHYRTVVATDSDSVHDGSSLIHGSMPWRSQVFMRNGETVRCFRFLWKCPASSWEAQGTGACREEREELGASDIESATFQARIPNRGAGRMERQAEAKMIHGRFRK